MSYIALLDSLGAPMVRLEIDEDIPVQELLGDSHFTDIFGDTYAAQQVRLDTLHLGKMRFCNLNRYQQRAIYYNGILGGMASLPATGTILSKRKIIPENGILPGMFWHLFRLETEQPKSFDYLWQVATNMNTMGPAVIE